MEYHARGKESFAACVQSKQSVYKVYLVVQLGLDVKDDLKYKYKYNKINTKQLAFCTSYSVQLGLIQNNVPWVLPVVLPLSGPAYYALRIFSSICNLSTIFVLWVGIGRVLLSYVDFMAVNSLT